MTFETAEKLLKRSKKWAQLSEPELVQLVPVGSWLAAIKDDRGVSGFPGLLERGAAVPGRRR